MERSRASAARRGTLTAVAGLAAATLALVVPAAPASATDVGTEAALRAAFADPAETLITLTGDIAITDCATGTLTRTSTTALVLDGAGHEISMAACPGPRTLTNGVGSLTIVNATLTGAAATVDGGAVSSIGPLTLGACVFSGNTGAGNGGAVYGAATVTVTDCDFTANVAGFEFAGSGGAIFGLGAVSITDSAFRGNQSRSSGGAVFSQAHATVVRSSFQENVTRTFGGALGAPAADVTDSDFVGNSSLVSGGGGVSVTDRLTAVGSTFRGNTAPFSGGAIATPPGGTDAGIVELTNSTVSGNSAIRGGGISARTIDLRHATVAGNTAVEGANLDFASLPDLAAQFRSFASVVAQPIGADNCFEVSGANAVVTSGGDNFVTDDSCRLPVSDVVSGGDPVLGPLAANGGPTETRLPLPGSPLIDVIPAESCGEPLDQRGVARPAGPLCDIGAVDVASAVPVANADQATFAEDAQADVIDVLANDTDADPDPAHSVLRITSPLTTSDQGGAIVVHVGGTGLVYRPPADFAGTDTFTYEVSDFQGNTATALVTITVIPVDDPPVAVDDAITVVEGQSVTFDPLANDHDVEGDPLTAFVVSGPASGTAACDASGCTYTPGAGFVGTDQFVYVAEQETGLSPALTLQQPGAEPSLGTVTVTVLAAPPDTTPPTTAAPTDPPTTPPAAPTVAPTSPPTVPAASLPATGSGTASTGRWALAVLVAGLVLAGVAGAVRRPRRRPAR